MVAYFSSGRFGCLQAQNRQRVGLKVLFLPLEFGQGRERPES